MAKWNSLLLQYAVPPGLFSFLTSDGKSASSFFWQPPHPGDLLPGLRRRQEKTRIDGYLAILSANSHNEAGQPFLFCHPLQ